ncbi:MAG: signal recognition particle protein [Candidatus Aenigmarchaeota archaeon]|nr:signal recognition particle protein [Candidatus Aenigmarchaeota archaeon]
MLDKLKESIEKLSRLGIVDREHVEELVRDVQRTMLAADVDVTLVMRLSDAIREKAMTKLPDGLSRKEHVIKIVYDELTDILGGDKANVSVKPKRILLSGLYGTGKTTTAAKLARFYQKKGLKTTLVACDTFRPAAYEQLEQLAQRIDAQFYGEKNEKNAARIAKNALKTSADVLIFDTSGRNALDAALTEEIKSVSAAVSPDERILVIPADIGQAAREQAKAFHDALGITDVIVTKMDSTAKGGGALTACKETGAKVIFITTGENVENLEQYDPKKFVARIVGFPDMETLLEKAKESMDEKKAEKVMSGSFTIDEFYSQFESMKKMGSFSQILDMMGLGRFKGKIGDMDAQEGRIKKWKHMIDSMTRKEKADAEILNPSRVKRIALGSGTAESEVRELLANYTKSKKLMKSLSPAKLKRSGMLRRLGM